MVRLHLYLSCFLITPTIAFSHATTITPTVNTISDQESTIELNFDLEPNDFIYKEYINLSIDNPYTKLSDWKSNIEPVAYYDSTFKDTKKIFNKNFTLTTLARYESSQKLDNVHMRIDYYSHKKGRFCEAMIPLALHENPTETNAFIKSSAQTEQPGQLATQPTDLQKKTKKRAVAWQTYITALIKTTKQPLARFVLVFLLGLLFSLTPCIYPMIPVTIGILQAQASNSMLRNFLSAFLYSLGISTIFAILGLLATFAGQRIGNLMVNPWIILLMVALLTYVALSLFNLYDLYIPRFLKNKQNLYTGSLLSAFIFGLISGTVASPCVSPGLILVLTIVSNLQNLFLGFFLLFAFGLGLTLPLLVIGTFSTAITMLPQAGEWMVEVKHLLGFILFGMCFYFLNFILPWHLLLWLIAFFVFATGIFYLYTAQKTDPGFTRTIKTIIGIILIGSSVFFVVKGIQALYGVTQITRPS